MNENVWHVETISQCVAIKCHNKSHQQQPSTTATTTQTHTHKRAALLASLLYKLCVKKCTHTALDTTTSAKNTRKKCCCHAVVDVAAAAAAIACNSAFWLQQEYTQTHTDKHIYCTCNSPTNATLYFYFFAIHAKCV